MKLNHISSKVLMTLFLSITCLVGNVLAQTTVYVDGSVATTGDGTQAAPFKTIAEALELTDEDLTVLIAGGAYANEPENTDVLSGQTIIGSYDSTFTTSDPEVTPTIVDMGRLSYEEQNGAYTMNAATEWTMMNMVIKNCSTGEHGDTENGGAMYIKNVSQGTLRGITFYNCTARFEGASEGGTARDAGAVCIRDDSTVVIEDCVFDSCSAVGSGGAIRMRSPRSVGNDVKIYRSLFTNCGSRSNGSVIDDSDGSSQLEIVNCLFIGNGVDVERSAGTYSSHVLIRSSDKTLLIYNCSFIDNINPDGNLFTLGNSGDSSATKQVVNCLFSNNITGTSGTLKIFEYGSDYDNETVLENNLFFNDSLQNALDPDNNSIIGINGNIEDDPQFMDEENGDYHVMAGSPAEDAGQTLDDVLDDYEGTSRPVGEGYDIGALEGQGGVAASNYYIDSIVATASSVMNENSGAEKSSDGSGLNEFDQHDTSYDNMWVSDSEEGSEAWIEYEFDKAYKLEQMQIWNSNYDLEFMLGWGIKTAKIEYSTDGATWLTLSEAAELAQAPGTADYDDPTLVDCAGISAQYIRITCTSTFSGGTQCCLSEVRFVYLPVIAMDLSPADGSAEVSATTPLSWVAGVEADVHEIYLGTDMQTVADSTTPTATVSETTYAADLQMDTTYYWKVTEVNDNEIPTMWSSSVSSFTTSPYIVVEDFESYGQLSPYRLYQTWLDGLGYPADDYFTEEYEGNGTGAIVGYDPTAGSIMEYANVHGGYLSMPLYFDGPSETTKNFDSSQDWSLHGITTLVIHFYGDTSNRGDLYVKIGNTEIAYPGSDSDIATEEWTAWEIDLASSGASISNVSKLTIGIDGSKALGQIYVDDILLK